MSISFRSVRAVVTVVIILAVPLKVIYCIVVPLSCVRHENVVLALSGLHGRGGSVGGSSPVRTNVGGVRRLNVTFIGVTGIVIFSLRDVDVLAREGGVCWGAAAQASGDGKRRGRQGEVEAASRRGRKLYVLSRIKRPC